MSLSIFYTPANSRVLLDTSTPSSSLQILDRAFGQRPIVLNKEHLLVLHGIAAADHQTIWSQLIAAINTYGCLTVDAE